MNLSFNEIVLAKAELDFVEKLLAANTWVHENAMLKSLDPSRLLQLGFIEETIFDNNAFYLITNLGESYMRYLTKIEKDEFWKELRNWISFGTGVSGFILSILSICLR